MILGFELVCEDFVEGPVVDHGQVMTVACALDYEHRDDCAEVSRAHFEQDGLVVAGKFRHLDNHFRFEVVAVDLDPSFFEEIHL